MTKAAKIDNPLTRIKIQKLLFLQLLFIIHTFTFVYNFKMCVPFFLFEALINYVA